MFFNLVIVTPHFSEGALMEFLQVWHKHPLGLKDELIICLWSNVKATLIKTVSQEHLIFLHLVHLDLMNELIRQTNCSMQTTLR